MDDIASFLHMGGYAVYVWASYAFAAAVLIGLLVATLHSLRANERMAAVLERDLPRRRRRRSDAADRQPDEGVA